MNQVEMREILASWHVGDSLTDDQLKKLNAFLESMYDGLRVLDYPRSATDYFVHQMIRINDIAMARSRK